MLHAIELFHSIQGEGQYAGVPSIFVRTTGCNLRCVFRDSICDTAYSSFHPEKPVWKTEEELIGRFKEVFAEHPRTRHVVITGGEPLLQREGVKEFLTDIFKIKRDWVVTIETNGTLPVLDVLSKDYRVSLYSVSPKLHTSVDYECKYLTKEQAENHDKTRINCKNLFNIVTCGVPYQFKFVYSGPDCIKEINEIYNAMWKFVNMGDQNEINYWMRHHPNKNTWLMPEGITQEQIAAKCLETATAALANGWAYTDRLHIRLWNDKKGV